MRKVFAIMLTMIFAFSTCSAFCESVDLSIFSDDELRLLRQRIDVELSSRSAAAILDTGVIAQGDIGEFFVAILNIELIEDYSRNPAVMVTYLFTNNDTRDAAFMSAITDHAYQAGQQLETSIIWDSDAIEYDSMASFNMIKPGASAEIKVPYTLIDTESPIELTLQKLIDFSDNPEQVVVTLAIPEK